jgi:NAD(P)-dependent dehydrogenase (short-subunit alcohol dehydrogenase family)
MHRATQDSFQNVKKIFLTGASSGIGKAIAIALAAQEHQVWGTSRDVLRLPHISRFHPVSIDLSDPDSIDAAFNSAMAEAGRFDTVINNAGSGHFGPAENLSPETIANQFQLLVFGHIQLMQLAIAAMRRQEHGLIINVTSLASRLPVPFMAAYNAAKAAMAAFTMSTQLELTDSPVRIVDLQPGDICTEFNDAVTKHQLADPHYKARAAKAWRVIERNMETAPRPELVARHVLRLIEQSNPPPRVTVGDAFQSKIAPLIFRFLPQRVRIWGLKQYYRI